LHAVGEIDVIRIRAQVFRGLVLVLQDFVVWALALAVRIILLVWRAVQIRVLVGAVELVVRMVEQVVEVGLENMLRLLYRAQLLLIHILSLRVGLVVRLEVKLVGLAQPV